MVLRKSFYIRWSAGRSPRVHEVNPGRDPSIVPRASSRYVGEFSSYTVSVEQSDRVPGTGRGDSVHQGPGTARYR